MANGIASLNPFAQGILPGQDTFVGYTVPRARQMEELLAASQPQSIQDPAAAALMNTPTLREEFDARRETYRGILGDPEEAESFEEMMNLTRGDVATVEERRAELASIVGEEDAQQTPDSVLAMLQPIMLLNAAEETGAQGGETVDQGIGGLAEQEMQQPVQGDMAGGIMSMMGG